MIQLKSILKWVTVMNSTTVGKGSGAKSWSKILVALKQL